VAEVEVLMHLLTKFCALIVFN